MDTESTSLEVWDQIKELVAALEKDMLKNGAKHNCSAGVRVRHGVRNIAKLCKEVSKQSLSADKVTKSTRMASPEALARKAKRDAAKA